MSPSVSVELWCNHFRSQHTFYKMKERFSDSRFRDRRCCLICRNIEDNNNNDKCTVCAWLYSVCTVSALQSTKVVLSGVARQVWGCFGGNFVSHPKSSEFINFCFSCLTPARTTHFSFYSEILTTARFTAAAKPFMTPNL